MKILLMKLETMKKKWTVKYQNSSFSAKDLLKTKQVKNHQIVNQAIYSINELRSAVIRKQNLNKIISVVEKIINFNNKLKDKGLKMLTIKQMFQKLPIVLAQIKDGNTFEDWLNEIRKIIYYLYRANEVDRNVYNNIINSIKV